MAKKKTRVKKANQVNRDGLAILDQRFGVRRDTKALREQFRGQAEVAEMLYSARQSAGLTQKQLAELAGTTQQVISQLEDADYQGHSVAMLRRIATALDRRVEIRLVAKSSAEVAV